MKKSAALLLTLTIVSSPSVAWTLPQWVENLSLWQWYTIPNTALSRVEPPSPEGNPASKITAWCGATLKTQGSVYLIAAAGGHADYAGNEVDALALNVESPQWVELHAPSAHEDVIDQSQYYLDLRPAATHTFYATQFINARNRLVITPDHGIFNPSEYPPPPSGYPFGLRGFMPTFNMATNEWEAPGYAGDYGGTNGDPIACMVAKHPVTEDIYYSRYGSGWWKWTQATGTWTYVNNNGPGENYCGAAIDPVRSRMLVVGSFSGSIPPRVLDLNGNRITVSFGGLGGGPLAMNGYPGVVYDVASDRFLVVYNSGGSVRVLRVHPSTWVVDQPATTGTTPATRQNGIHNSVQYVPELGGIVLANNYNGNVYFMRTGAAGPAPSDSIPPADITTLQAR